jgi:hypothetical protein
MYKVVDSQIGQGGGREKGGETKQNKQKKNQIGQQ